MIAKYPVASCSRLCLESESSSELSSQDTEEMMVTISHEGINELWKVLFGTIEKEVMKN